ncbi:hypothetical protein EU642_22295 [Salmonella enterica]|nr:hypothetical protein [Salmonella enterica]EAO0118585.1 hypothetical protein [Salmonella enterica]EAO3601688.1 hypothetical protein [Salmonella enterica]EAR6391583.1 hypothetical protein [Salmonella enterica]EAV1285347.1 hypothetical protein [Salmonella enterica]
MKKLIIAAALIATSMSAFASEVKLCQSQSGQVEVFVADLGNEFMVYSPEMLNANIFEPMYSSGPLKSDGINYRGNMGKKNGAYLVSMGNAGVIAFGNCQLTDIKLPGSVEPEEAQGPKLETLEKDDPNYALFTKNRELAAETAKKYSKELNQETMTLGETGKPGEITVCDVSYMAPLDNSNVSDIGFVKGGAKVLDKGKTAIITLKRFNDNKPSDMEVAYGATEDGPYMMGWESHAEVYTSASSLGVVYSLFNCKVQK